MLGVLSSFNKVFCVIHIIIKEYCYVLAFIHLNIFFIRDTKRVRARLV